MLFFVLYSIHFFFSLFFCSNRLQCNNRQGRAGQDVDSNKGQDRGAGRREEESDEWAGVLMEGDGGGEQREQGTGWPEERSGEFNGWPAAV